MVSRNDSNIILYPLYFDSTISRQHGRKVPKKYAVEKPTVESLAKSAQSLGLHPVLEKESMHPSTPYKKDGRVIIDKKGPKTKLLIQIANRL